MQISEKEHVLGLISKSIGKWESIAAGIGIDSGPNNCALCKVFWFNNDECEDCPISLYTNEYHCDFTPYQNWYYHMLFVHKRISGFTLCKECRSLAQKEVQFLEEVYQWYYKNF